MLPNSENNKIVTAERMVRDWALRGSLIGAGASAAAIIHNETGGAEATAAVVSFAGIGATIGGIIDWIVKEREVLYRSR